MAPEIPTLSKLEFKELLSHTFPGFFLALSVFMLLDVLSPKDLTLWAFGTLTKFVSALGFIILLGTILGILIDGIQHLIEEKIFVKLPRYDEEVEKRSGGIYKRDLGVRHYYYYKRIGGDAFTHLTDNYYRYAEFYGNIFISLIAFSSIAPFYFCYVLRIPWLGSIIFGCVVPAFFAGICILSSYTTFVKYHSNRIDMILEYYSGHINSIEITANPLSISADRESTITAQLKRWNLDGKEKKNSSDLEELKEIKWKGSELPQKGVEIKFEISPENIGKVETNLFMTSDEFESDLNSGKIPRGLKAKFKEKGYPLSDNFVVPGKDTEWVITDEKKFIIRKEGGKLHVYLVNHAKTNKYGNATVVLIPHESGTATVEASSKGFIPGKVQVYVKD